MGVGAGGLAVKPVRGVQGGRGKGLGCAGPQGSGFGKGGPRLVRGELPDSGTAGRQAPRGPSPPQTVAHCRPRSRRRRWQSRRGTRRRRRRLSTPCCRWGRLGKGWERRQGVVGVEAGRAKGCVYVLLRAPCGHWGGLTGGWDEGRGQIQAGQVKARARGGGGGAPMRAAPPGAARAAAARHRPARRNRGRGPDGHASPHRRRRPRAGARACRRRRCRRPARLRRRRRTSAGFCRTPTQRRGILCGRGKEGGRTGAPPWVRLGAGKGEGGHSSCLRWHPQAAPFPAAAATHGSPCP
jgi:hypothetical protein